MVFRVVDPNDVSSDSSEDSVELKQRLKEEKEAKLAKIGPESRDPNWNDAIKLTHDGGIKKRVIRQGWGDKPIDGSTVKVHYISKYSKTQKIFKNSREANQPYSFAIGQFRVIRGWDLGIASMKIGEISEFRVSPEYGYGRKGDGTKIVPGNTWLDFEIELLDWHNWTRIKNEYLYKRMKKKGKGDMYDVSDTSGFVYISFIGKIYDDINKRTLGTFARGEGIQFLVDDDASMPRGFHDAVRTMNTDEISEFKIEPAIGYKKMYQGKLIDDTQDKKTWFGNPKLGIKYNDVIYFKIEMHKYKNLISRWKMNSYQIFDIGNYYKDRAKMWYQKKQWLYAKLRYLKAMEYFEAQDNLMFHEKMEARHMQNICLNNLCLCLIQMKEYHEAIFEINKTLEPYAQYDLKHPPKPGIKCKSYCTRARAQMEAGLFKDAKKSCDLALQIEPNNKYIKVLRKKIKSLKKDYIQQNKNTYSGFIDKNKKRTLIVNILFNIKN